MIIFRSFTFIILVSSLSGQKEIDFKNLKKMVSGLNGIIMDEDSKKRIKMEFWMAS